jgi:hypothetical protein
MNTYFNKPMGVRPTVHTERQMRDLNWYSGATNKCGMGRRHRSTTGQQ